MKVCWISGWATDLSDFSPEIHCTWQAEHSFVNYGHIISNSWANLPQVKSADILVGWSLGAQQLASVHSTELLAKPRILIAPFAEFCQAWPLRVLQRMQVQLQKDPSAVLQSFAEKLDFRNEDMQTRWIQSALRYSTTQLAQGLDLLAQPTLQPQAPVHLVWGMQDQIVTPLMSQNTVKKWPCKSQQVHSGGHWFLGDWSLSP